jgi:hypothetical protein
MAEVIKKGMNWGELVCLAKTLPQPELHDFALLPIKEAPKDSIDPVQKEDIKIILDFYTLPDSFGYQEWIRLRFESLVHGRNDEFYRVIIFYQKIYAALSKT